VTDDLPVTGVLEVGIVVRDFQAAVSFYGETLGLAAVGDIAFPGGMQRRFLHGDAIVKLLKLDDAPTGPPPPGGPSTPVAGLRLLTLRVSDVAGLVARCEQHGTTVVMPAFDAGAGSMVAIIEDPDGNWIELTSSPTGADEAP
jgi:predicted enzyme related to lactoylglutathione lyase